MGGEICTVLRLRLMRKLAMCHMVYMAYQYMHCSTKDFGLCLSVTKAYQADPRHSLCIIAFSRQDFWL